MNGKETCRGSVTVEAAFLFPLILALSIGGFSLMAFWYSQWEQNIKEHQEQMENWKSQEHLIILHWEQWGELLGDEDGA